MLTFIDVFSRKRLADGPHIYLLLYVDDMLIAAKLMSNVNDLKDQLKREFETKDLGATKRILGMEIPRDRPVGILYVSEKKYIERVLQRFGYCYGREDSHRLKFNGHDDKAYSRDQVGVLHGGEWELLALSFSGATSSVKNEVAIEELTEKNETYAKAVEDLKKKIRLAKKQAWEAKNSGKITKKLSTDIVVLKLEKRVNF
ncbi:hypothetical protein RJ639_043470 [Escallonia herrerae]|uniref:Reverse transcriptase Ty1/copia-type domain-containing protein n=1 Tax=Escallonia herrerae TaxID=1293975 RepID=A0AA89B071_9ASTE|nr:hypothetical protein RJ639_043470 [Escallonia herrerae]